VDVFEYPTLGALGELHSARVGTDGSGLLPGWHLQLLVVTHLPTGRVWQFRCARLLARHARCGGLAGGSFPGPGRPPPASKPQRGVCCLGPPHPTPGPRPPFPCSCFNWIDRRVNFNRWLTLDSVQQAGYSYAAAAAASAAKWNYGPQPALQAAAPAAGYSSWAQPASPQRSPSYRGSTGAAAPGGSPLAMQLHSKQQYPPASSIRPGSPSRLQLQGRSQQWGAGSAAGQPGIVRVGSGMPGSPLIGARR
jgi:hypothetical protein